MTGRGSMPEGATAGQPIHARRAHLAEQLEQREQQRRRTVLVAIGTLIVFSTSPVFGHHFAARADALLIGHDHLFNLCLIALHSLLAPVHLASHLVLLCGLLFALSERGLAALRARRTLHSLGWWEPEPGSAFGDAARRAGLELAQVRIATGLPNPAFTVGWWQPRVYVDERLEETLGAAELDAVVAHEAAHVRRRDPLRLSGLRFLASLLFYLPALRRLAEDVADDAEIAADDAAAGTDPLVLASALVKTTSHWGSLVPNRAIPSTLASAGVGFHRVDLLERRVRRLLGEETPIGTHLTRRSLAGAGAVLTAVWVSGLMMAHPLPGDAAYSSASPAAHASMKHCLTHHEAPWKHLFCLGFGQHRATGATVPCPHAIRVASISD